MICVNKKCSATHVIVLLQLYELNSLFLLTNLPDMQRFLKIQHMIGVQSSHPCTRSYIMICISQLEVLEPSSRAKYKPSLAKHSAKALKGASDRVAKCFGPWAKRLDQAPSGQTMGIVVGPASLQLQISSLIAVCPLSSNDSCYLHRPELSISVTIDCASQSSCPQYKYPLVQTVE